MTNGNEGRLAKAAIIISVFTLIVTVIGVYLAYGQVKLLMNQNEDLREQFDKSGPVLSVETSVQLMYHDGRQPVTLFEQQHPTLTRSDLDTPDATAYLVYKVTNTGRSGTALLGADLRVGPDTIHESDPLVRSLCAAQGGGTVDCRQVFSAPNRPRLEPGWTYYFTFL
jgi:hypothetical protein